jgi:FHA domain
MSDDPTIPPAPVTGAELQAAARLQPKEGDVFAAVPLRQRLAEVARIIARLPAAPCGPCLIMVPPDAGTPSVHVLTDIPMTAGRSAEADLPVPDDTKLSRRHFQILRQGEDYELRDLDSSNGIFLAGQSTRLRNHLLRDGDLFQAGRNKFLFWLGAEREEA